MPAYLFWGEDRFSLLLAVKQLRKKVVDPQWQTFNDQRYGDEELAQALNESVTPPFGTGGRIVVMTGSRLFQPKEKGEVSEEPTEKKGKKKEVDPQIQELERTLLQIPESNHLVFIAPKVSRRLKSTLLLEQYGTLREFAPIPPWKEDELLRQVQTLSQYYQVSLNTESADYLVEALGNDTARLHNELAKLALYPPPLALATVKSLVVSSAQTTFQLAEQIAQGATASALATLAQLFHQNEAPLKICAVLVYQFRTWLWVKLLLNQGVQDPAQLAEQAGLGNPRKVYILKKQVQGLQANALLAALPQLLLLEAGLKQGQSADQRFPQAVITLSNLF
jgi:DNA polymerase-3 subunit delta